MSIEKRSYNPEKQKGGEEEEELSSSKPEEEFSRSSANYYGLKKILRDRGEKSDEGVPHFHSRVETDNFNGTVYINEYEDGIHVKANEVGGPEDEVVISEEESRANSLKLGDEKFSVRELLEAL